MSILRISRLGISSAMIMYKRDSQCYEIRAQIKEMTDDDFMEKLKNF